jgi:putative hydrolase
LKYLGDYHTHTYYSHGKGSVEANVLAAIEVGLSELAITDHGYRHTTYNVRRSDYKYMRRDVDAANENYPVKVYLGLETNLVGNRGQIDVTDEDVENLDILLCGYHRLVYSPDVKEFFGFWMPNFVSPVFGTSDRRKGRNTEAYIRAIQDHPIDVITHMTHACEVDHVAVARAAKEYGTFIELNGKNISMTDEEILEVAATGVGLIVNSDAHSPGRVGEVAVPDACVERLKLPPEQIVNLGKIPDFRLQKLKNKST